MAPIFVNQLGRLNFEYRLLRSLTIPKTFRARGHAKQFELFNYKVPNSALEAKDRKSNEFHWETDDDTPILSLIMFQESMYLRGDSKQTI